MHYIGIILFVILLDAAIHQPSERLMANETSSQDAALRRPPTPRRRPIARRRDSTT